MDRQNLVYFASINVRMLYSSSYSSQSKGLVEVANKCFKYALIKYLTTYEKTSWVHVLPLICRLYNTTKLNKHGYSPLELLFGTESDLSKNQFGLLPQAKFHHMIRNDKARVDSLNKDLTTKLEHAREQIDEERTTRIDKLNKTRYQL